MKLLKYALFTFLICLLALGLDAQETTTTSINEGSIDDQFEFVIKRSSNWNDAKGQSYEVIKRNMFLTLKAHTLDSLNAVQEKLNLVNTTLGKQENELNTLKAELEDTKEALALTNKEKDSMTFLGMQMSKFSYSLLMWSIVALLLLSLLVFIFKFKNSNVVTKATKTKMTELENEFKTHRKNALEREQKIKRELQNYLNKQSS